MRTLLIQILVLSLNAVILLTGQLLIKINLSFLPVKPFSTVWDFMALIQRIFSMPVLLLGYCLSVFSGLLWVVILAKLELNYAVPLYIGIYYILLLATSYFILHEAVNVLQFTGALLILFGILITVMAKT